ncbi:hypothetical protein [Xenorhabdus sp. IM139775]|uniref:hypothetical protein n=1 Tax=Xenorhabdus sp. IM139775 TaxID=3025876 RepID=UPI002358C18A|nr:hypothetical protein [Xenorhabdus sp. IM139775]MDC9593945.1 hypothetical protein [Xenorhabdus sp. IM139775]
MAKTNSISLKTNSQITNVEITKYQDDKRQPVVDVTNNKIMDYFLVKVKDSSDTSNITLTATTDITGSANNVNTYTQHQYTKQDIDPKSLIPIVVGSTIIEDFSPTADGSVPDKSHANLNVLIYPRFKNGAAIKNCQIPLQVEGIDYTRLYAEGVEIYPFNDNMYYVNTDNNGDVNLKFYARKLASGYATKVAISNMMDDITSSLQENSLFITQPIIPSDNLEAPIISSINGSEVPPAGTNKNSTFDVMIPKSTLITSVQVNDTKPVKIPIASSLLDNFGVDDEGNPTPVYIYYIFNKEKYSQNWKGFLDTALLGS